ncbi:MAG: alpha-amylase family glycosyl hydrolase [Spirochaetaceae bacterium]|nr:alpha-amylase family glycosyl hydrolase [Spirochaetaceae bacterium]
MDLVFYHIYPLGFAGAPQVNDLLSEPENKMDKLLDWLDYLHDCGFNAIYFGPVFESKSHGYDTIDYYTIDRRLGTNESFSKLCRIIKSKGFFIVLDGVINHVSRDFGPFKDLREKGISSLYTSWFKDINFNNSSSSGDPFSYHCWEGHETLVSLNLQNNDVKNHIFQAVQSWFENYQIDGLRLDVAYCLDKTFLSELKFFTKGLSENFWVMGEIIHGDYRDWIETGLLDSATNYECYKGIFSSLNDNNYFEIAHSLKRLFSEEGIYRGYQLYNFVDNHDVNRIFSILNNKTHIYNAMILLFLIPGIPSIYYGSEWQLEGEKSAYSDEALRPCLDIQYQRSLESSKVLETVVRKLIKIRREFSALQNGSYGEVSVTANQLVFKREWQGQLVLCAVNSSDTEIDINIPSELTGHYRDVLNEEDLYLDEGSPAVHLWPNWGRILVKK